MCQRQIVPLNRCVCVCVCVCNQAGLTPGDILCYCPFKQVDGSCCSLPQHTEIGGSDHLSTVTLSLFSSVCVCVCVCVCVSDVTCPAKALKCVSRGE